MSLWPSSKGGCQPSLALYWLKPLRKKKFQVNNLLWPHRLLSGTDEKWQSCAPLYKQRYNYLLLPTWHVYDSIYWHFWEEEKLRLHDMWSGRMMIGARSNRKKSGSPAGLMTGSSQLRSACPAVGWSPTRGRASYWTLSIWIFWIWNEIMLRIQSQTMSTNRTVSDWQFSNTFLPKPRLARSKY